MIIAPNRADMTETMINVKAHPSSPAASEIKKKYYLINNNVTPYFYLFYSKLEIR